MKTTFTVKSSMQQGESLVRGICHDRAGLAGNVGNEF
jgi:hypothetical protein